MARSSYLAQSAIAVFLMAAPIGDTTVLLLFSVSLECLLALMLVRERQLRLRSGVRKGGGHIVTPFPLLVRTAPHMRAHRAATWPRFLRSRGPEPRWLKAPRAGK